MNGLSQDGETRSPATTTIHPEFPLWNFDPAPGTLPLLQTGLASQDWPTLQLLQTDLAAQDWPTQQLLQTGLAAQGWPTLSFSCHRVRKRQWLYVMGYCCWFLGSFLVEEVLIFDSCKVYTFKCVLHCFWQIISKCSHSCTKVTWIIQMYNTYIFF
jgi:hypothetical protein